MSLRKLRNGRKIRLKQTRKSIYGQIAPQKNILEILLQIKAAEKNLEVNQEELLGTKEAEDYRVCCQS